MSFGEKYGTATLMDELVSKATYLQLEYEYGNLSTAEEHALNLMQGAAEIWRRLVEERVES